MIAFWQKRGILGYGFWGCTFLPGFTGNLRRTNSFAHFLIVLYILQLFPPPLSFQKKNTFCMLIHCWRKSKPFSPSITCLLTVTPVILLDCHSAAWYNCESWVGLDEFSPRLTPVASHSQIFFKKFIIFYCMSVCLYTWMCTTCVRLPWRVEQEAGSLGTGVTNSRGWHDVGPGTDPWSFAKSANVVTTEPSLLTHFELILGLWFHSSTCGYLGFL